jgi:hypothetical protein
VKQLCEINSQGFTHYAWMVKHLSPDADKYCPYRGELDKIDAIRKQGLLAFRCTVHHQTFGGRCLNCGFSPDHTEEREVLSGKTA